MLIVISGSEEMLMPTGLQDEHHPREDCGHEVLSSAYQASILHVLSFRSRILLLDLGRNCRERRGFCVEVMEVVSEWVLPGRNGNVRRRKIRN